MRLSKRRRKHQDDEIPLHIVSSVPDQAKDVHGLSLNDALAAFLHFHAAMGHSKLTIEVYSITIGMFLRYLHETHHYVWIKQVTEADMIEWLAYLHIVNSQFGRAYSSRTIETYSRNVRSFFSWLAKQKHIPVSPMAGIEKPKTERALIRVFTEDELKLLDEACDRPLKGKAFTEDERKALIARDRALLWLLLSTGVRISEACGLLFSDIDWKEGMIYVRGKGAKERRIPFGKIAQQYLDTYVRYWRGEPLSSVQPDDFVFLNSFGRPLKYQTALDIFVRLKKVAGITDKRVSPHTCRHWFAVNAIRNGMPTVVLKNILGHENWDMIEVYVRLAEQDVRHSYMQFSPVDLLDMHRHPKGKRTELRNWRNSRKQTNRD